MTVWLWSSTSDGGRELTAARDRKLKFRRRGPAEATFTIDGRHDEAGSITELVTDIVVRRDGVKVFRGRVGATGDSIDQNTHALSVSAGDYRALLARRIFYAGDDLGPHTGVDAGDLVEDLLDVIQSRTDGGLGVTLGAGFPAGLLAPDTTLVPGESFTATLNKLEAAGIFDWEVDAELAISLYPGGWVNPSDVVLDYGGTVSAVNRTVDPGQYANAGRYSGAEALTPVEVEAGDLASRPEGRWDFQAGNPDIVDQDLLDTTADAELDRRQDIQPAYSLTLKAGAWQGRSHLWVGDMPLVRIRSGRLDVLTNLVVEELDVSLGGKGDETVTVTVGAPRLDETRLLAAAETRLRDLERR